MLREYASPENAKSLSWFFKTGPGEYGAGDVFMGVNMPHIRRTVRGCRDLSLPGVVRLLKSKVHEERMLGALLLVERFNRGDTRQQRAVYRLYIDHLDRINNWDLVDLSAPHIVGGHLFERSRRPLYRLACSRDLWRRRVAILSTFYFIRRDDFDDTMAIADLLLHDHHDLIHKAVGWMLREMGKRDQAVAEQFLLPRYGSMPRTMLRYAIERFPEERRLQFLNGTA